MSSFQDYLRQDEKRRAEENILKYEIYADEMSEILEDELRYHNHKFLRDDLWDGSKEYIRLAPELKECWGKLYKEKSAMACDKILRDVLDKPFEEGGCKIIKVKELKEQISNLNEGEWCKNIWFGSSADGINIRVGDIKEKVEAIRLDDNIVHGIMAGRTGSGKSCALHVLITSLMYEYAPWEININLADFKILEFSKYGNTSFENENGEFELAMAPHVSKIAATDSMEYVLSVMYDMYEKMDIRQKVFAALGIQKLSDFRKKYDVVLPREILIIDEFQQMYELASPKQVEIINQLIKMITKLGRATGYHLFFASQSLAGTIRNDVLANFKLRLCLSATEDISSMILGNEKAAEIDKGCILANSEGGDEKYNKLLQVPLLKDERDKKNNIALADILRIHHILAKALGYQKENDFYRQDYTRDFTGDNNSFENDLKVFLDNYEKSSVSKIAEIEKILLLGDSCVYARKAGKDNTLEYMPLKLADRKNILCIGDSALQRGYMLRLLLSQYVMNKGKNEVILFDADPYATIGLDKYESQIKRRMPDEITQFVHTQIQIRMLFKSYYQNPVKSDELFKEDLYNTFLKNKTDQVYGKSINYTEAIKDEKIEKVIETKFEELKAVYEQCIQDGKFSLKYLPQITIFINGFHTTPDLMDEWNSDRKFIEHLKKSSGLGIRFIFIGTRIADIGSAFKDIFGYYFLMTNDESNFTRIDMVRPKEYRDDIVIIKAKNEALNKQKPGLYILNQDIKIVKAFNTTDIMEDDSDIELFKGIVDRVDRN